MKTLADARDLGKAMVGIKSMLDDARAVDQKRSEEEALSELGDRLLATATQLMVARFRFEGLSVLAHDPAYDEVAQAAAKLMVSCAKMSAAMIEESKRDE